MQLKELLNDDRAVSPVIGVILMVAITVILAAVIGTFVLGLGDQVSETTPSASIQSDYDGDTSVPTQDSLSIAHNGGDTLSESEVKIAISGASSNSTMTGINSQHNFSDMSSVSSGGDINAGTTATVDQENLANSPKTNESSFEDTETLELQEATVRVVWQSAQGDSSATLGSWSGPDA